MTFFKWTTALQLTPRFMGVAYSDPCRHKSLCVIIPFNFLVRFYWQFFCWLKYPGITKFEKLLFAAHQAGRRQGQLEGKDFKG